MPEIKSPLENPIADENHLFNMAEKMEEEIDTALYGNDAPRAFSTMQTICQHITPGSIEVFLLGVLTGKFSNPTVVAKHIFKDACSKYIREMVWLR